MEQKNKITELVEQIVELGKEVEAASHAATGEAALAQARAALHQWIDECKGVVVNPAFGRVTVIHDNGQASTISSSQLAFRLSAAGITQSA